MIRNTIAELTRNAILAAQQANALPAFEIPVIEITRPPRPEMGDYSSSLPLKLAALARRAPIQIGQVIAQHMPSAPAIGKVETAAPGYINFTLAPEWVAHEVAHIRAEGEHFGDVNLGAGLRVQVEHTSANPTGPLTVGSARNASLGDTLARILRAAGYTVETEYYVNDAGSQVRHLGESIFARYAQELGHDVPLPEDGYQGKYVQDMAHELVESDGDKYLTLPRDQVIRTFKRFGVERTIEGNIKTLAKVQVYFDNWFSEESLRREGLLDAVLEKLAAKNLTYVKDGALWFKATEYGLDKDAVLVRSANVVSNPDERATYLASDLPYVWDKLVIRGFDRAIYVWGADHQGDVPRVLAGAQALGLDPKRVNIIIYQLVRLMRGGEKIRMSKRSGEFDTLEDLVDEVGADAVRFLLITASADIAMDFDLQLAAQQSNENPVYYVQYAHARIASILRNAADNEIKTDDANIALLTHPAEQDLIKQMLKLEEVVEHAALKLEPHHLPHYALDLAACFHQFYKQCRVLSSDPADQELSKARLQLVSATKQVLARTLDLMGVSAPETM
jgi:arginyl-tRNA synthetase